jgi:hypothetical protein
VGDNKYIQKRNVINNVSMEIVEQQGTNFIWQRKFTINVRPLRFRLSKIPKQKP